jgi:hypothetical protein
MSSSNRSRAGQPYLNGKRVAPQPLDELTTYSHDELISMDQKFCERMHRAFRKGLEKPPSDSQPNHAQDDEAARLVRARRISARLGFLIFVALPGIREVTGFLPGLSLLGPHLI